MVAVLTLSPGGAGPVLNPSTAVSSASRHRIAFRTVRTVGVIAASIEALQ
jgi:hypothetical protein